MSKNLTAQRERSRSKSPNVKSRYYNEIKNYFDEIKSTIKKIKSHLGDWRNKVGQILEDVFSEYKFNQNKDSLFQKFYGKKRDESYVHAVLSKTLEFLRSVEKYVKGVCQHKKPAESYFIIQHLVIRYHTQLEMLFPLKKDAASKLLSSPENVLTDKEACEWWKKNFPDENGSSKPFVDFEEFYKKIMSKFFNDNEAEDVKLALSFFVDFPKEDMITTFKLEFLMRLLGPMKDFADNFRTYVLGCGFLGFIDGKEVASILKKEDQKYYCLRFSSTMPLAIAVHVNLDDKVNAVTNNNVHLDGKSEEEKKNYKVSFPLKELLNHKTCNLSPLHIPLPYKFSAARLALKLEEYVWEYKHNTFVVRLEDIYFCDAIRNNNKEEIDKLIDDADVNASEWDGNFPLNIASASGNQELVIRLLDKKANINQRYLSPRKYRDCSINEGDTILHTAINNNQKELVDYLLKKQDLDIIINAKDKEGRTPLHLAFSTDRKGNIDVFISLLEKKRPIEKVLYETIENYAKETKEIDTERISKIQSILPHIEKEEKVEPKSPEQKNATPKPPSKGKPKTPNKKPTTPRHDNKTDNTVKRSATKKTGKNQSNSKKSQAGATKTQKNGDTETKKTFNFDDDEVSSEDGEKSDEKQSNEKTDTPKRKFNIDGEEQEQEQEEEEPKSPAGYENLKMSNKKRKNVKKQPQYVEISDMKENDKSESSGESSESSERKRKNHYGYNPDTTEDTKT